MSDLCNPDFAQLAATLGFPCTGAPPIVHLRNPFELSNWTLPVVELLMVSGALMALVLAIRRLRRDGDPTNLALWFASVVYLLIIEPPQYFPEAFGVADQLGVVFAHNVFTVDFMYDRLPLYIVALYPATITLAFDVVRAVGVFDRRGAVIGSVCVGFVNGCFYEVFDHLGPQLRWWAWNDDNPLNHPMMNSVPMTSVVIFAMVAPAALAFFVHVFVGRRIARGRSVRGWGLTWRTLAAGALVAPAMTLLSLPTSVFERHKTVQAVVFAAELVLFAVVAVPVLVQQWRRTRREGTEYPSTFVKVFGALYLAIFAVLWLTALPDYAGAIDGMTSSGTPIGNVAYATVCFVFAGYCVVGVSTVVRRGQQRPVSDDLPAALA
ncbi:MAG: hypothetical protein QOJ80_7509 [Mycobacterium sp.]|nr:hypothetical protein [Mycobacterium sp.]